MYDDDAPGPAGDRGFDQVRIDAVRVGLDVHEHRDGIDIQHGGGRCLPGQPRDDHLVAYPDIERLECQLDRHGAVRDAPPVGRCLERAEAGFELPCDRTLIAPLAGRQDGPDPLQLRLPSYRPRHGGQSTDGVATEHNRSIHRVPPSLQATTRRRAGAYQAFDGRASRRGAIPVIRCELSRGEETEAETRRRRRSPDGSGGVAADGHAPRSSPGRRARNFLFRRLAARPLSGRRRVPSKSRVQPARPTSRRWRPARESRRAPSSPHRAPPPALRVRCAR